jgi:dehydrogenase/reductase SDR family protein 12
MKFADAFFIFNPRSIESYLNWMIHFFNSLIDCLSLIVSRVSLSSPLTMALSQVGQFMSTSQFYFYGRWHFTQTGWKNHSKLYSQPDILSDSSPNLAGKVYMITGANSGIGKEIAYFLAMKAATVYLVCRSNERGLAAQNEIISKTKNKNVFLLVADVSLEKDIYSLWDDFVSHQKSYSFSSSSSASSTVSKRPRLDCLICNAGVLLNHHTMTEEGVEMTFATHLLFGSYLLGSLAIPLLQETLQQDTKSNKADNDSIGSSGRMIFVSSGGMYNSKLPSWDVLTSTGVEPHSGQMVYSYAKRGQVLLCEEWAKQHRDLTFLSCHPGWVDTPGVNKVYSAVAKRFLSPLRSLWEGSEGIIWLALASKDELESGGFYLDRALQTKHIAGPFFTEGSFTKNSPEEVEEMMKNLEKWSHNATRPTEEILEVERIRKLPLQGTKRMVPLEQYLGKWYVLGQIPTLLERNVSNSSESYALLNSSCRSGQEKGTGKSKGDKSEDKKEETSSTSENVASSLSSTSSTPPVLDITFNYCSKGSSSILEAKMLGKINNFPINSHWNISLSLFNSHLLSIPIKYYHYLILDFVYNVEEGLIYTIVGVEDRSYVWIMVKEIPSEYHSFNVPLKEVYEIGSSTSPPRKNEAVEEETKEETKAGTEVVSGGDGKGRRKGKFRCCFGLCF